MRGEMNGLLNWLRRAISPKPAKPENDSALKSALSESPQRSSGQEPEGRFDSAKTELHKTGMDNAPAGVESQLDALTDLDPTVPELQILSNVETGIDEEMGFNPYDTAAFSDKLDAEKD